jgi:hypothetical protein
MSKQLSGKELIDIVKKKIDFDGTLRTDGGETLAWRKVATCLADDLSLVLGRQESARQQLDELDALNSRKNEQIQELRKTVKQLKGK